MQARSSKRFRNAMLEDGVGYVAGLLLPPGMLLPYALTKEVYLRYQRRSPFNFTDWVLESWPHIYGKERSQLVTLPYKFNEHRLPQILVLDNTQRGLGLEHVLLTLDPTHFKLPPRFEALTEKPFNELSRKLKFSNECNLRLTEIQDLGERVLLTVQPVYYRDYVHTNLVLDAYRDEGAQTLRSVLHGDGRLEPLKDSPLGNNFGINVLVFTADGALVLQKRSRKVAFRRGELCPSGSGTFSATDLSASSVSLAQMHVLREAFEEIGLRAEDVAQVNLLGITRELIRGGEPDMFVFATTNVSKDEFVNRHGRARDKWESRSLLFFDFGQEALIPPSDAQASHRLLLKIDQFIDEHADSASVPLLTAVALWLKFHMFQGGMRSAARET